MRKVQALFSARPGILRGVPVMLPAVLLLAGAGYFWGGHTDLGSTVLSKAGFSAKSLVVSGNVSIDNQGVEYAIAPQLQRSLFSFDTDAARAELLKNPWLKSANVRKVYPSTVVVDVVEREPFAFWKTSNLVTVIARDGVVLGEASPEHLKLPQVVGTGANLAASEFISVVARFPKIVDRASAFVRVADRRWDIVLKDDLKVLLPEEGWKEALVELDGLQQNRGILDRELVHIDMRLPDRLVLRLPSDDAQERQEYLEKLLKRDWHRT